MYIYVCCMWLSLSLLLQLLYDRSYHDSSFIAIMITLITTTNILIYIYIASMTLSLLLIMIHENIIYNKYNSSIITNKYNNSKIDCSAALTYD